MKVKNTILELPKQSDELDEIVGMETHDIKTISFSSVVVDGKVQHYALVIWHDEAYGDHNF